MATRGIHVLITITSLQFSALGRQTNENAEEWMGRHRLADVECNYKDRHLKEQFIHRLNDNDMLAEIIRELTKAEGSTAARDEQL